MRRKVANLNFYLFLNLIILCIFLLGIWRGEPVWDASIRLPSLLLFLAVINTVLIFRESIVLPASRANFPGQNELARYLRAIVGSSEQIDDKLLSDSLETIISQTGIEGSLLFLFEPAGNFSLTASAGRIPTQLSGARFFVSGEELHLKHPGGLGEEKVCKWEPAVSVVSLNSKVTRLFASIIPLSMVGNQKGLWLLVGKKTVTRKLDLINLAVHLETILSVKFSRSKNSNGRFVDNQTGLLRYEGFKNAFELELERSERYHQNLSVLLLSIHRFEENPNGAKNSLESAVSIALRESLRRLDLMFFSEKPGVFIALLTETNSEVGKIVAERINSAFRRQAQAALKTNDSLLSSEINMGLATYPDDSSVADVLMELAEDSLNRAKKDGKVIEVSPCLKAERENR
ncbi:diguanylate cyclase [bacterium]|nr:diguanylate cyclase [bacterium]